MSSIDANQGTRRRVLDAAAKIAAAAGFDAVSIAALSKESGVSNGSVYHHFGSKNGVLAALLYDAISDYQHQQITNLDQHQADAEAGVRAAVEIHLRWTQEHPEQGRLLLDQRDTIFNGQDRERLSALNQTFVEHNRAWLERQATAGRLPVIDVEVAHAIVFAPCQDVCKHWLLRRTSAPPSDRADALGTAAWAGLIAQSVPR